MVWFAAPFGCNTTLCIGNCQRYAGFLYNDSVVSWCQCQIHNVNTTNPDDGCSDTVNKAHAVEFYLFQAVFGLLFPVLGALTLFVLCRLKRPNAVHYILFLLMTYACLIRSLWLWLDPFNIRGILPPWLEQVLYGNGLWALLGVYLTVLGLWFSIYLKTKHMGNADLRNRKIKHASITLTILLGIFLVLITSLDALRAYPLQLNNAQNTLRANIMLALYLGVISIFILVPGIAYFILGRKLSNELNKYNTVNGIKVQDGYIRKISFLTTSSCIIAFFTVSVLIAVGFILEFIANPKTPQPSHYQTVPAFALGVHYIYRTVEIAYLLSILSIFYFKVNPKILGTNYQRMQ